MTTLYVRLSDLNELEEICPPEADTSLNVHIVSDLAWVRSGPLVLGCVPQNEGALKALFPNAELKVLTQADAEDLQRRFGC